MNRTPSIKNVFSGRALSKHKSDEVLRCEFRGDPCVTVYHATEQTGGMSLLDRKDLGSSFQKWLNELRSIYGQVLRDLQIKSVMYKSDEARLRSLFMKAGINNPTLAAFDAGETLECYFFIENGRFRVAPFAQAAKMPPQPSKKPAQHNTSSERARVQSAAEASAPQPSAPVGLGRKARVLIVDDSKTMRQLLRKIVEKSSDLEFVGEAERPSQVRQLIHDLKPDVMTLDINMPEMTGVELLRQLLPTLYIPTVMISSIGINEGKEVLDALELGAVDYIHKPSAQEMSTVVPVIQEKIFAAAHVKRRDPKQKKTAATGLASRLSAKFQSSHLIAVGASTGGTEAIKSVFTQFPADVPPIVVVQHIPPYFSTAFANRLNDLCAFEVREAKDGDELKPGLALVAPGGLHLEIKRDGSRLFARVFDGDPVNRFKPSVDVLFRSVARELGNKATGLLMTGMGSDGAKGLLEMKKAGAHTIAQDKDSCVVFGMPRAAIEIGAADEVKALEEIPEALMKAA